MTRFSKRDWEIINDALALLEAEDNGSIYGWSEAETDRYYQQIAETRKKVHARRTP